MFVQRMHVHLICNTRECVLKKLSSTEGSILQCDNQIRACVTAKQGLVEGRCLESGSQSKDKHLQASEVGDIQRHRPVLMRFKCSKKRYLYWYPVQ